jgi:hypothetical protein
MLALIASVLLALPWSHDAVHAERRHIGRWTLRVLTDTFTSGNQCRLFGHSADVQRGALVLRLARDVDTSGAIYRIDGGPPIAGRADQMELARMGLAIHADDLANPSGGLVRIPMRRVRDAHIVAVQVRAFGPVIQFEIDGLGAALDAAYKSGCTPESFK